MGVPPAVAAAARTCLTCNYYVCANSASRGRRARGGTLRRSAKTPTDRREWNVVTVTTVCRATSRLYSSWQRILFMAFRAPNSTSHHHVRDAPPPRCSSGALTCVCALPERGVFHPAEVVVLVVRVAKNNRVVGLPSAADGAALAMPARRSRRRHSSTATRQRRASGAMCRWGPLPTRSNFLRVASGGFWVGVHAERAPGKEVGARESRGRHGNIAVRTFASRAIIAECERFVGLPDPSPPATPTLATPAQRAPFAVANRADAPSLPTCTRSPARAARALRARPAASRRRRRRTRRRRWRPARADAGCRRGEQPPSTAASCVGVTCSFIATYCGTSTSAEQPRLPRRPPPPPRPADVERKRRRPLADGRRLDPRGRAEMTVA